MLDPLTIEVVENAIVSPLRSISISDGVTAGAFDGGVCYDSGLICEKARHMKASYANETSQADLMQRVTRVSGTHLFGGMLQAQHFGHFLTESLSRLWAVPAVDRSISSVVFYLRDIDGPVEGWVYDTFSAIFPGLAVTIVRAETQFERLLVPDQAIHRDYKQIVGHPLVRSAFHRLRSPTRSEKRRTYVSRSKLHVRDGGILGEKHIENMLLRDGYSIAHPERMSIADQIKLYNDSGLIIFAEGSALHLFALCATSAQTPFVIWRRKANGVFSDQLKSFNGKILSGTTWVQRLWIAKARGTNPVSARAQIDMRGLEGELRKLKFIDGPAWDEITEDQISAELRELGQKRNDEYLPHPV